MDGGGDIETKTVKMEKLRSGGALSPDERKGIAQQLQCIYSYNQQKDANR